MDFSTDQALFRMVDAALNRATEGLRFAEDVARMKLNHASLTSQLKSLRHELTQATVPWIQDQGWRARDSKGDVGRSIGLPSEYQRAAEHSESDEAALALDGWSSLVQANFKRAQQALRTLEELAKLHSVETAQLIEALRYRSYELEQQMLACLSPRLTRGAASIYVLLEGGDWADWCPAEQASVSVAAVRDSQLVQAARLLMKAGVDWIQFRNKRLSDRQVIAATRCLVELSAATSTRIVVNDRPDIAVAVNADAVHVGQDEITVDAVRRIVGHERLIGVSTHSVDQALQAERQGADYIGIGPVFPSQTKSFNSHIGISTVAAVVQQTRLPVFAIGGIQESNVDELAAVGCRGIAIQQLYQQTDDVEALTRRLRERLNTSPSPALAETDHET